MCRSNIEDANITLMSKMSFKNMTKMEGLTNHDCKLKEFMKGKSWQLVEGIKGNYEDLHRGKDMRCQWCMLEVDTQSHVLQ